MKIEIIKNKTLFYKQFIGPYGAQNKANMELFKEVLHEQNLMSDHFVIVARALDNPQETAPNLCRYDIGITDIQNKSVPGLSIGAINDGKYAVIILDHTEKAINDFWLNFPKILVDKSLIYDNSNVIMERYDKKMLDKNLCEILIPIK